MSARAHPAPACGPAALRGCRTSLIAAWSAKLQGCPLAGQALLPKVPRTSPSGRGGHAADHRPACPMAAKVALHPSVLPSSGPLSSQPLKAEGA